MSLAAFLAAVPTVVEAIKDMPEVIKAFAHVFSVLQTKQDPTPALMHLQIVAAAHGLNLDETKV